jgi:PAS domain-containing protein
LSSTTAALTSGVAALVTATASDAAEQTATRWASQPAGDALLEAAPDPRLRHRRPSADLEQRVERMLTDWQRGVLELVRVEVGNKRSVARFTAYAVNATGLLVMIGVFASTAFIPTGAEIAVAGGTTVASQKLLEAIFGDRAVRQLAERARQDLMERVRTLLDAERQRYLDLIDRAGVDPAASERLRETANDVEQARVAAGFVAGGDALPDFPEQGDPIGPKPDPVTAPAKAVRGPAQKARTALGRRKDGTGQKPTKITRRKR